MTPKPRLTLPGICSWNCNCFGQRWPTSGTWWFHRPPQGLRRRNPSEPARQKPRPKSGEFTYRRRHLPAD